MKSVKLYNARFRAIEIISYFLLAAPWAAGLFGLIGEDFVRYTLLSVIIKVAMSAAILGFILLLRDVRKKNKSLELLKQQLTHAAIHDLKNPLTAIIGALSILDEPDMDPEVKDKLLKVAGESSQQMVKLIQVLLDTDRMEIAEMVLQKRELAVGPLIKEAIAALEPVSVETGIKLTVTVAPGMPLICADHDLLMRVFENLVLNAFKYSRRGGTINLSAGHASGMFHFEVSDTGIGIAPENIKRAFEKYFRVEGQDAGTRKGSGIGLYFCRLAVEAHKGKIHIDSKPGSGTHVVINIPGLRA